MRPVTGKRGPAGWGVFQRRSFRLTMRDFRASSCSRSKKSPGTGQFVFPDAPGRPIEGVMKYAG